MNYTPKKVICLTEESVEFLYDMGLSELIIGVSIYVERPIEAKLKPKIGAFTHANFKKIIEMKPDLVLGFSDIQKDIARELIDHGLNVFITNQRSIEEIVQYLFWLGSLFDVVEKTKIYIDGFKDKIFETKKLTDNYVRRPVVYIEEWDEPTIIGIKWFTELVEICGGSVLFKEKSTNTSKAQDRIITHDEIILGNPDIILACWCGKKFDRDAFIGRVGFDKISAVKENRIYELDPAVFLQPGPALFKEGIPKLMSILY